MKTQSARFLALSVMTLAMGACASATPTHTTAWQPPTYWDDRIAVLVPYMPQPAETPPALGNYETDDPSRFIFRYVPPPEADEDQATGDEEMTSEEPVSEE